MVDMQLSHATRAALPSPKYPGEQGGTSTRGARRDSRRVLHGRPPDRSGSLDQAWPRAQKATNPPSMTSGWPVTKLALSEHNHRTPPRSRAAHPYGPSVSSFRIICLTWGLLPWRAPSLREDHAGAHRVDTECPLWRNAVPHCGLARQLRAYPSDSPAGRGTPQAVDGGGVDDGTTTLLQHLRDLVLHAEKDAFDR